MSEMSDYAKGLETASLMIDERIQELEVWAESAGYLFQAQLQFKIHELNRLAAEIAGAMNEPEA